MIEAARFAIRHLTGRQFGLPATLAALCLFAAACVSNGGDGHPASPSPEPSIARTTLPGTATAAAPAPSATSFIRPTSVIIPTTSVGEVPPPAIDAVIARAAEEYGVSAASVAIIAYEQQIWPSTALGCPEPGHSYAQIVTNGYVVTLNVGGTAVTYHADETGAAIVRCDLSPDIAP